ncbi:MAG: hypothetical protein F4Z71_00135 [Gammaproteobacteria bacterium]|nr:hypothetical protein [Gammaproteobacteria bacterium]
MQLLPVYFRLPYFVPGLGPGLAGSGAISSIRPTIHPLAIAQLCLDSGVHRWRDLERLVNPAKIVVQRERQRS